MSITSMQDLLHRQYALQLSVQRLTEWSDLYEAACLAWWKKHPTIIQKALETLEERIYLIDYTEDTTKQAVIRVYIAGLTLGLVTRLVEKPKADAVQPIFQELDTLYGRPDLIVCDDDATIKGPCKEIWPEVPIQTCIEHLLRNLAKTFLHGPRSQAHQVLQQAAYRKKLDALLVRLKKTIPKPWPAHGVDLRELIELLLFKAPGGDHARPPALQKLQLFEDVWTHLNYLFRGIKGQQLSPAHRSAELEAWRTLKAMLPPTQVFQGLQDERLLQDPFYQALLEVKAVVDAVHANERTHPSLQAWRSGLTALARLRTWHWALKLSQLRRLARDQPEGLTVIQAREADRLQQQLAVQLAHHQREIQSLLNPSPHVSALATAQVQRIIASWELLQAKGPRFGQAAAQLRAAAPDLIHFVQFKTAPASQQALEGQNNRLKQVFRQQSGHVHARHRFAYHAEGTSMALQFHATNGGPSPLQRLGIELGPHPTWFADLSWAELQQAKRYLLALRQPRRAYLAQRRQGVASVRRNSLSIWLAMVLQRLQP